MYIICTFVRKVVGNLVKFESLARKLMFLKQFFPPSQKQLIYKPETHLSLRSDIHKSTANWLILTNHVHMVILELRHHKA